MREETDRILLQAASAGASLDDLAAIAAYAIETWRARRPDADEPDPDDRCLRLGTTFGDAGVIRGDLTPECRAAVRAVLEALGKKAGPEDDRTEAQRFHDALQLACALVPRAVFTERLTYYLGEVNAVHPFREGNGRAQRAFFEQLASDAGFILDWQHLDADRNVAASAAIVDGDPAPTRKMLDELLREA